jgi:hypothetical protein
MYASVPSAHELIVITTSATCATGLTRLICCRHSQKTKDFVDEYVAVLDADEKVWDQNVFNQLARSGFNQMITHPSNPNLFMGWNRRLVIGVLPVSAFLSGHTYHVQRLHQV